MTRRGAPWASPQRAGASCASSFPAIAAARNFRPSGAGRPVPPAADRHARRAEREIREHLAGKRRRFTVRLDLGGLPVFQRRALAAARRIPYGRTATYGRLAAQIGRPKAARAVGRAMARNPVPLLVPCHRVTAAGGALGGFGGGAALKRRLLALENVISTQRPRRAQRKE